MIRIVLQKLGFVNRIWGGMRSNVTDTDSDILRQAKDVGEDWPTPGNRF